MILGNLRGHDALDWTNVGNLTKVTKNSLNLDDGEVYYASIRAVSTNGERTSATEGRGWQNLECPTNYVKVFGNETPGLGGTQYTNGNKTRYSDGSTRKISDFCMMKYEAKMSEDGSPDPDGLGNLYHSADYVAIASPDYLPWRNLPRKAPDLQFDAETACSNIGDNYTLTNNSHWQAIARDIESVASNWLEETTSGSPNNMINIGHICDNDSSPDGKASTGVLTADASDDHACFGIGSEVCSGDAVAVDCGGEWVAAKRTHTLSSGEVIWDLAGNVAEWVIDDSTDFYKTGGNPPAWYSNGVIRAEPYDVDPDVNKKIFGPLGDHTAKTGSYNGGLGHFYDDVRGGITRGGKLTYGGLFHTDLTLSRDSYTVETGFRCVYAP